MALTSPKKRWLLFLSERRQSADWRSGCGVATARERLVCVKDLHQAAKQKVTRCESLPLITPTRISQGGYANLWTSPWRSQRGQRRDGGEERNEGGNKERRGEQQKGDNQMHDFNWVEGRRSKQYILCCIFHVIFPVFMDYSVLHKHILYVTWDIYTILHYNIYMVT